MEGAKNTASPFALYSSGRLYKGNFERFSMAQKVPITVAYGDGIGPEIMNASLHIIQAAGADLELETIEIGEKVYERGIMTGIEPSAWDSLRRTRVFYKAPITTPQGGGFKSMNVTARKTLGLYANVRPCVSYHPFIQTKHPVQNLTIIRENEEDLYAGIEYRQTDEVYQCLKLISRPGSEKIIRYAFEYARANNRKKVTCFSKDNIMKMTDGLFHKVFDEIAVEYPDIVNEHWIVDIGSAKMADTPEAFDVIVMENLYGDILSDVAAQIAGSVGLAGSANIGTEAAMFEAIHGSAPRRANQNLANPSGLLLGGVMMMVHVGQPDVAENIHNAWLRTVEEGIHTYDVFREGVSKQKVGTKEFAEAVVARLGKKPETLAPVSYAKGSGIVAGRAAEIRPAGKKDLVGVDVFLHHADRDPNKLGEAVKKLDGNGLTLSVISNRGEKVWPDGLPETFCTDHWRLRYLAAEKGTTVGFKQITNLLDRIADAGFDYIKTENLYNFDGQPAYSQSQN
jgi:isocitrate dehydrogenase